MGNTSCISLPNSDGIPLFRGWEPLWLSGCLSTVSGIHLSRWRGPRWAAMAHACMASGGLFRRAGRGTWWASRAAQERSGVSDWISVRVLRRDSPGVCCQSREKWSRQACLSSEAFWRNIPISAVLLSCFAESVMSAEWIWLIELDCFCPLRRFQRPTPRRAARLICDCYMLIR